MIAISEFDFSSYIHLVNFLGGCFDTQTEIILYSLDNIDNSIIAVHNGHISGKTIGDPLSGFAIAKLKDKGNDSPPYYLNQMSLTKDRLALRSNSFFILDKSGNPRGMLTINTDVSKFQKAAELLRDLARLPDYESAENAPFDIERLQSTPKEIILKFISEVTHNTSVDANRLTPKEKQEVVSLLNRENFFLMKGAVSQTAAVLESSEATIYRYLSKINKKK
ncbi:PAS domain-containing protein [Fusibacter bizertensis]|uniref:PAS domain-containing protein n=1 Tax=Fusibacter bizertensis TaxID=1488331 RepID=A0ABT6NAK5_9FIRM|nr:PAS domain-containing protein [Fusibacter bizertensis]MDH8677453.1 PAS domain-containing protein [Fusibacter bizertensis]